MVKQTTVYKLIDTLFKGNLFRSRLEARWAVFFDALADQLGVQRGTLSQARWRGQLRCRKVLHRWLVDVEEVLQKYPPREGSPWLEDDRQREVVLRAIASASKARQLAAWRRAVALGKA